MGTKSGIRGLGFGVVGRFCALLWLGFCLAVSAAPELPSGGKVLFPARPGDVPTLSGLAPDRMKVVRVEKQAWTNAWEITVPGAAANSWDYQLHGQVSQGVEKGDVVHLRFFARNLGSMTGSARLGVVVELAGHPMEKIADTPATVGTEWECIDLPMVIPANLAPDGWMFNIRLGYAEQKVQVAGLQLVSYGRDIPVATLPRVRASYAGREPGAPWRVAALERIERLRKGDLTVSVRDAADKPVAGVEVHAVLQRHEFGFGTCVSPFLLASGPNADRYRKTIKELFNCAVIENDLKWQQISRNGYGTGDALVGWLRENGLDVRGHCLIWPGVQRLPRSAVDLLDKPEPLRALVEKHMRDTVGHYRGQLNDWDVVNEAYVNHAVMDTLGEGVMVDWFRFAHEADPACRLYINDYAILASGDMLETDHQNHYFRTIKRLKEQGAVIHGVGMQGHFGSNITSPPNLLKILDRFAGLGLRIKVTELDMQMSDEALRADYFRDFFIALFSHESVDAILQWGFWEGSHWIPSSALYARDWTVRPHGKVFEDLMKREWKTDVTGKTDAAGRLVIRGFKGTYNVTADLSGKSHSATVAIGNGGGQVTLHPR